jgi:GNAT superfamily N-acetyltransferase
MTLTEVEPRLQRETMDDAISRSEPMNGIVIRDASTDDAPFISQMIRRMTEDMASYGGHAPATEKAAWQKIEALVADELKGSNNKYLIAESANGDPLGVTNAELVTLGNAFAPKRTIHIHVVYVLPPFRRSGVAGSLLVRILDWGRAVGAEQCTLNVLANNPARSLYDEHGFSPFELKLVRSLQTGD